LCKKPPARPLAAYAAKEYFFRARILLILQSKINKIRALKNFILPPQAAEYFLHNLCFISPLAAFAAKDYFFKTPILFIFRSKMNKIGVLKNFILPQ